MKKKYVVRIVTQGVGDFDRQCESGPLLECLRYAGYIEIHRQNETGICFDLLPPAGLDSKIWAEQNVERMRTFNINAVVAPAWPK